uniref:Saposin B-type domain-containing protein n=1 Tax=Plectus sambesii TaxID=2011161 RepID=A0A914WHV1_9BILA
MKVLFVAVIAVIALAAQAVSKDGQPRLFCDYCTTFVGEAIDACKGAKTEDEVKQLLIKYCDELGGDSSITETICNLLVGEGVQYIWGVIQSGGTTKHEATEVCSCFDLCDGRCPI